jgi:beta-mannosidase
VWQTQLLQALTVTTGLEHWRRSMHRTRGVLYWQLNDCWPGPSWSSIDYAGHWKALHYAARRAFAPVALSIVEDSGAFTVEVHVTNETRDAVTLPVEWTVLRTDGVVLGSGVLKVTIDSQTDQVVAVVDAARHVSEHGARDVLIFVAIPDLPEQRRMAAFVPLKHLSLRDPELSLTRDGDTVTVTVSRPSPWVWLDAGGPEPLRLSDNFVAMVPGSYSISVETWPSTEIRALSLASGRLWLESSVAVAPGSIRETRT